MAFTQGDKTKIGGYEFVARIEYGSGLGEALVCHNNSSHYLVFTRESVMSVETAVTPDSTGTFEDSFPYHHFNSEEDTEVVYRKALEFAVQLALGR